MNSDAHQVDTGSKATDFQPTTRNPQEIGGTGVQNTTNTVQSSGGASSAQELYQRAERQENLKVQIDGYSTNTRVSVAPDEYHSNAGLFTVTGALFILLAIVAIVMYYDRHKPVPDGPTLEAEVPDEAPVEATTVSATAIAAKNKSKKKKKPTSKKKKSTKKK
jgi:hypothetical protein